MDTKKLAKIHAQAQKNEAQLKKIQDSFADLLLETEVSEIIDALGISRERVSYLRKSSHVLKIGTILDYTTRLLLSGSEAGQ
jgi:hypothetical protein